MSEFDTVFRDLRGRFLAVVSDPEPAVRAADLSRQLVVRRTRDGQDRHGQPFAPYAESTRRQRRKRGLQTRTVDLTASASGSMLDDLVVTEAQQASGGTSASVAYGSARSRRIGNYHTSSRPRRKIPRRDFFGLTPDEGALVLDHFGRDVLSRLVPTGSGRRLTVTV